MNHISRPSPRESTITSARESTIAFAVQRREPPLSPLVKAASCQARPTLHGGADADRRRAEARDPSPLVLARVPSYVCNELCRT